MDFQINKTEGDLLITYGGWIDDEFKDSLDNTNLLFTNDD
jgi:hypothetical protein